MISSEGAYTKHFDTFTAIQEKDTETPKMPREDVIGEAEELKVTAFEDNVALIDASIDPKYIKTIDERIGAYSHASSLHETSLYAKSDALQKWKELEDEAYEFKWELIHALRFAVRKNPDQLKLVKKIAEGRGRRDLSVDFKDINVLGRKNKEALTEINFDFSKLEKAGKMHDSLCDLLADANTTPEEIAEAKTAAYQAYTWLKEAVDEIREYGQFRFWKDEDRLNRYKSDYYQGIPKMKKKG